MFLCFTLDIFYILISRFKSNLYNFIDVFHVVGAFTALTVFFLPTLAQTAAKADMTSWDQASCGRCRLISGMAKSGFELNSELQPTGNCN